VITIIKRFEYDQDNGKSELEKKILKYYNNYYNKNKEELSENEINDYLYKKAIGKIIENEDNTSSSSIKAKEAGIKRRIEFINEKGENDARHYAILSYVWGGSPKEDIK
jgi:hypothetical protein